MDLPLWLRIAESLAVVATPVLIAVGGFFAWYKFIRQGEHDPRLQPSVSSETTIKDGTAYIIATIGVQNTGQVDVVLDLELSGLLMMTRKAGGGWREPQIVYSVFTGQDRIQPSEVLGDQIWIEFSLNDEAAVCLELAIAAEGGAAWRAVEIIPLLDGGNPRSRG